MSSMINTVAPCLINPIIGCVTIYNSIYKTNKFDNVSNNNLAYIIGAICIVIFSLIMWIMSIVATYRLTQSMLQCVLCLFFSTVYIVLAWLYYGVTSYKLVKK